MTLTPISCVIDACVGIKLFIPEIYSQEVMDFLELAYKSEGILIFTPDLFFVECTNILWKKVRKQQFTEKDAIKAISGIRQLNLLSVPTEDLMERALGIACQYGITAYDASYVALSERNQVPLLTADDRLANAMSGSSFDIILLGT